MAIQTQPEARSSIQSRLGAPRLAMRVDPGDARAYEIKAGVFVQIVDVEGKECSDFLAFNGCDHADEMNLTLTRTNGEGLWPAPGQYVYADSGLALLRMEEDLVGRHDTTLPACNAAYYAAMSYPDHKNCTDNFNRELAVFGLGARNIWEPINFLFNTRLAEGQRTIVIEEPLSRPGDYVLMRAETNLLLATSACTDDLSPTSGWNPTEILVRVYPPLHEE